MPLLLKTDPRYPTVADTVTPYLERAIERGDGGREWDVPSLLKACIDGRLQLWVVVDVGVVIGALVTHIMRYPKRSVLEIVAFGVEAGTDAKWKPLLSELKDLSRRMGLQSVVGTGRPGWGKFLKATRTKTVWEIDL